MPHTVEVKNTSYAIPFGSFIFGISSYRIESAVSFISKPTVSSSIILQSQGKKPTLLTIRGRFYHNQTPIAPILSGYLNGRTSFYFSFNRMRFSGLYLSKFICNESTDDQFSEYELTFITTNDITEVETDAYGKT